MKTQFLFWKTDLISCFKDRKKDILFYTAFLLLGIVLGVTVGIKIGAQESPYGPLARLFVTEFSPIRLFFSELFRFVLLSAVCLLCYYFLFYRIYPIISLLLFGKHFGEIACLVCLSDSISAFVFSLLFLYLPLAVFGGSLLIRIALQSDRYRIRSGGYPCKRNLKNALRDYLFCLAVYAAVLFILYFILCGVIFLLIVGI